MSREWTQPCSAGDANVIREGQIHRAQEEGREEGQSGSDSTRAAQHDNGVSGGIQMNALWENKNDVEERAAAAAA
ncbi:unnamed protein product [Merluccius merluccius]